MKDFLYAFLHFVDKSTYWKEDNDVTNLQVINEFISRNEKLVNACNIPDVICVGFSGPLKDANENCANCGREEWQHD